MSEVGTGPSLRDWKQVAAAVVLSVAAVAGGLVLATADAGATTTGPAGVRGGPFGRGGFPPGGFPPGGFPGGAAPGVPAPGQPGGSGVVGVP